MYHSSTQTRPSAAEGMRAYGLSGIELGHRTRERHVAAGNLQLREIRGLGRGSKVRQWLGNTLVRAGTRLAGEMASSPGTATHPNASMP